MGYPKQTGDTAIEMVIPKSKLLAVRHYGKAENVTVLADAINKIMERKFEIKISALEDKDFEQNKPNIRSGTAAANQDPYATLKKYDIFEEED